MIERVSKSRESQRRTMRKRMGYTAVLCWGLAWAGGAMAGGGMETFDGFSHTGGSSASGTFAGQDGSAWVYARARGDFSINGASPTLEKAKGAYIRSGTIPGGVGTLTLKYQRQFSPSLDLQVYVNGEWVGAIVGGDGAVQTWTSGPLNIEGDVVFLFSNRVNSGTVTLDDISWTGYIAGATPPVFDAVAMQAAAVGEAVAFVVSASGEPTPVLALQSASAADGYTFHPDTGSFTYLPPPADIGLQSFTFAASNPVGVATLVVDVMVREAGGVFGLETFDGFEHAGSVYASGTFPGQDGSTWTYALARGDQGITGASPTLDKARGAYIRSGTIPGGLDSLELQYRREGNQAVDCAVYVNGSLVGAITGGDGSIQTWSRSNLNISGDVVLLFSNKASSGRITLDDIAWTGYSPRTPAEVFLAGLEQAYSGEPRVVTATTAPAGLPVMVTYDGSIVPPTAAGSYAVAATVMDGIHDGMARGALMVAKADQRIAFPEIGSRIVTDQLALAATASSGLPVAYSVVSGAASIVNGVLTFQGTGGVSVAASQPGDANWNPAPMEVQSFEVMSLLAVSASHLYVRENGEGRFFVKLNRAPSAPTTVTVARVSGDPDLAVKSGAATVIQPWNWNWWQPVTLLARDDADALNGQAVFRVSISGEDPQWVTATELDDDIEVNYALASKGAEVEGGLNSAQLIDGVHASLSNYGALEWTSDPPASVMLRLKTPVVVSRIRLLNWDWLYPVLHRYVIESSMDGKKWTLLIDASAEDRHGWDDWAVPGEKMRYLRLTALSNSANSMVCFSELEVYGVREEIPAEVTLRNLRQTYDGTPREVVVETDPPALPVEVVYEPAAAVRRGATDTIVLRDGEVPVAAGTYFVQADVTEDGFVGHAYDMLIVERADQSISFPNPGEQDAAYSLPLVAQASSGLPVTFAVVEGPAILNDDGDRLAFSGPGKVTVVASQAGDDNWNPAPDMVVSFEVAGSGCYPVFSRARIHVREGGEGRVYVRLSQAPLETVVLTISRTAGAPSLAVVSGATRTFTPANWQVWQPVVLAAAADDNAESETATFRVSGAGIEDRFIEAVSLDGDIGENLAAAAGTTVAGSRAYLMTNAIDGIHLDRSKFAYVMWTGSSKGSMTLDLQEEAMVSRIRLLNWDWTYRVHWYTIECSLDGQSWTTLIDAGGEGRQGWDDWPVDEVKMRYVRFTGISNSTDNAICIPEWEVYGQRVRNEKLEFSKSTVHVREGGEGRVYVRMVEAPAVDVAYTISLDSGDADVSVMGSTTLVFSPTRWAAWQPITLVAGTDDNADDESAIFKLSAPGAEDQFITATVLDGDIGDNLAAAAGTTISGYRAYQMAHAIDGIHADRSKYAYLMWSGSSKGTMTLDLQEEATVSRIRLLNWDWTYRVHWYTIESSLDGQSWTTLVDAGGEGRQGWDNWAVNDARIRYLRFTGISNSTENAICIPEIEVYGARAVPEALPMATVPLVEDSVPISVLTSDGLADETGWRAVDGDWSTAWIGQQVGGGYLVIEYAPTLTLRGLDVDVGEESLADIEVLYSLDALEWRPLPDDLEQNPVDLNFLWVIFPDDGTDAVPHVLELWPNPQG